MKKIQVKFTANLAPYEIGDITEIPENIAILYPDSVEVIKTMEQKENKAILSPKSIK